MQRNIMSQIANQLMQMYQSLLDQYGPRHWWPGDSPFEVMVGAVLTQNTNWTNVEKALERLKNAECLSADKMNRLTHDQLADLIRPAGYFNIKAKRLKNLLSWFCDQYDGQMAALENHSVSRLREELLEINGIGRETADSIILYAFNKPSFVVDTYTHRIFTRHGLIAQDDGYEEIKDFFERHLEEDLHLYNEYHALIVEVGKHHCKPKPKCDGCPLSCYDHDIEI